MKKDYTPAEYNKYISKKTPPSNIAKDTIFAFLIGGAICLLAQVVKFYLQKSGATEETTSMALPVIFVFLGAFFTGLGLYEKLAKYAGAGTIVPITGFANSIVSCAMEFKSEGLVMGVGAKMFTVAGPVIVYGTISSVVVGFIYYLMK